LLFQNGGFYNEEKLKSVFVFIICYRYGADKNSTLCTVPSISPWLLRRPCFNDMYAFDKNSVNAEVLQNHFVETNNGFGKHVEI